MPYAYKIIYTCPVCGKQFESVHYKCPNGCPQCRKQLRRNRMNALRERRRIEGRPLPNYKKRSRAYDVKDIEQGAPESVYSPQCVIHVKRGVGECAFCGNVTEIINNYCAVCRANGANEKQCMNPRNIR